ncbi:MAG: YhgE/Pip domain-containing protein [Oscillospiraceae bacterium]|nr:YhgE/Pip domain-containing protein [Oscillospiraceae bacterium]
MKNVFKIFFSDIKAIVTHFFALVIILAVLVLPALYAWVNIYANWDPYGSTGNVPIALASEDLGYTLENGQHVVRGREIIEELAESTSIKWIITDSAEEAIAGVKRGDYYGALVMGRNLSRNMYDLTAALQDEEPSIIFYQNAKTNAIANKITTTAAATAEHNIQVKYLSVLIQDLLEDTEELLGRFDGEEAMDELIRILTRLRDNLYEYSSMIQQMRDRESSILADIDSAAANIGAVDMSDVIGSVTRAKQSAEAIEAEVLERIAAIDARIKALRDRISGMDPSTLTDEVLNSLLEEAQAIAAELEALRSTIPEDSVLGAAVYNTITTMLQRIESLEQVIRTQLGNNLSDDAKRTFMEYALMALNDASGILNDTLIPAFKLFFDNMIRDMDLLLKILTGINTTLADIQPVLAAAKGTIVAVNSSLGQLQTVFSNAAGAMDQLLQKVIDARDSDLLGELIELLHGDPEQFAEFFSAPVTVTTETIYPVENYGTAMAPFYTTLAIWVGCVVCGAIIKPEPDVSRLPGIKPRQIFWGRFLIFFFLGQIQAAIIVAGDIYLLGCQCLHPGLFFLCGAVTALVFGLLMYALTVTFGDIGKAIGVVIMIVQIAGSSGSYPIEILPEIFSKIYTFFPFPYAINAMRETLCGLYRYDLYKYLGELLLFGVLGALIGLKLRGHFAGVNEFVEEEMHETGVL